MRIFVSIDLSEEAKQYVQELQKSVPQNAGDFSFTKQPHITLKFLGEGGVEGVKKRLSEIEFKPFTLMTDKLGFFPSENYIKVLWLGLKESSELNQLAENVKTSLLEFPEDRPFHPHITLARIRHLEDKEAFKKIVEKIKLKELSFEVKSFQLMQSIPSPEKFVYEEIESYYPKPL